MRYESVVRRSSGHHQARAEAPVRFLLATAAMNAVTKTKNGHEGLSHTHAHRPCYVIARFFRSTSSGLSGRKGVIIRSGNGVRFAGGSLFLTAASANPAPSRAACTATTREKSGGGENGDSRRFVQTFDGAIIFVSA
jgi:hypothetical protein